jgi:ABC-type Zn2+ transport system substrate-binding protein/surface adhesin
LEKTASKMSKHSHNHESDFSTSHHGHVPYWKRAHTDWRFWIGVLLMLAAMIAYVLSDDLAWGPSSRPQPPPSGQVGK